MSFRSILVAVDHTAYCRDRIRFAVSLCDRFEAKLIGCAGRTASGTSPLLPFDPGHMTAPPVSDDGHLERAEAQFRAAAGGHAHGWIAGDRPLTEVILDHAYEADLIVTGPARAGADMIHEANPAAVLLAAGAPLLIAPPGHDHMCFDRIMICWKHQRECRRAVLDARPFLEIATDVMAVQVKAKGELREACRRGDALADALERHGVRPVTEALIKDENSTSELLRRRAQLMAADLIVAGGYGRGRVSEQIVGGVTHFLLSQSHRPVLLSH